MERGYKVQIKELEDRLNASEKEKLEMRQDLTRYQRMLGIDDRSIGGNSGQGQVLPNIGAMPSSSSVDAPPPAFSYGYGGGSGLANPRE